MRGIRTVVAMSCAAAAMAVLAAAPASADPNLTWTQQFQRPSADAKCVPPANQTPWQSTFTGDQEWTPSWAQWPNGGRGGWVCTRTIIWGTNEPAPEVELSVS